MRHERHWIESYSRRSHLHQHMHCTRECGGKSAGHHLAERIDVVATSKRTSARAETPGRLQAFLSSCQ